MAQRATYMFGFFPQFITIKSLLILEKRLAIIHFVAFPFVPGNFKVGKFSMNDNSSILLTRTCVPDPAATLSELER